MFLVKEPADRTGAANSTRGETELIGWWILAHGFRSSLLVFRGSR